MYTVPVFFSCGALPGDGHVVEREHLVADDLALLMALAGEEDDVARARFQDRRRDRLAAAGHLSGAGSALHDAAPDRRRILAPGIVVGDDGEVGKPSRHRAHLRALADVAVAAGAEDDDQPVPG